MRSGRTGMCWHVARHRRWRVGREGVVAGCLRTGRGCAAADPQVHPEGATPSWPGSKLPIDSQIGRGRGVVKAGTESTPTAITCPDCGWAMVTRRNRRTGEMFLGCSRFPACRGTRQIDRSLAAFQGTAHSAPPIASRRRAPRPARARIRLSPDLVCRPMDGGSAGRPEQSHDRVVRRGISSVAFTRYVQEHLRRPATRGLRGCCVSLKDAPTRDFFVSLTENRSQGVRAADAPAAYG